MEQYIPKSALVAEIKARINDIEESQKAGIIKKRDADMKITLFKSILSLVNTLEVKEVDLEKETKKWWKEHLHLNPENKLWMDAHQSVVFAKHFFELGMAVSNKAQKGE